MRGLPKFSPSIVSVLLVALCQGLLIVCFYRPMLVAVSRWEGLDGIAPPALLVLAPPAYVAYSYQQPDNA